MLDRYAHWVVRRRRWVLAFTVVGLALAGLAFANLNDRLSFELFVDKNSEAWTGKQFLEKEFGVAPPNLFLLVTAKSGDVDDPEAARAARALVRRLDADPRLADVTSYWTVPGADALRSSNRRRGLIVARIRGDETAINERITDLAPRYKHETTAISTRVGGYAEFGRDAAAITREDLGRAEIATGPLTLIALLVVFGSIVSALIPLGIAALVVVGTGAILWLVSLFVSVSSFGLFMTTILGLGLAIDYSLLMTSRFREELAARGDVEEATVAVVRTAGRTVLFSAGAVCIALAGLIAIPLNIMQGVGWGGMGTALTAGVAAVVVLPALLATLGERVNRGVVRKRSLGPGTSKGNWYRIAHAVMRKPGLVAATAVAACIVIGLPVLALNPELTDDRILAPDAGIRVTSDIVRHEFPERSVTPVQIAIPDAPPGQRTTTALRTYVSKLERLHGVRSAAAYRRGNSARLELVTDSEPLSAEAERLITSIRAVSSGFPRVLVTGDAANYKDVTEAIVESLPRTILIVALASFAVLAVQFGSLLLPLLAIALTGMSLAVMLGAYVLVYQEGYLTGLLGVTATGGLYINVPILITCMAYGLALDYQVFVLSRIKEEYERCGDTREAIALGLGRSGPIITAAACLIAIVFISSAFFATTSIGQGLGLGLGLVVLFDAFVIRGTVLPAFLALLGDRSWWGPAWLTRLSAHLGSGHSEGPL